MGVSGRKWELVGDRGTYGKYGSYTLSWGLPTHAGYITFTADKESYNAIKKKAKHMLVKKRTKEQ